MELSPIERLDDALLRLISRVVWRNPARRILKMYEFSYTEEDSFRDMAQAADRTSDDAMRPKYMLHALDEARHADLFRERAGALIRKLDAAGVSIAPIRRAMEKKRSGAIRLHEENHRNTLFETLGELEFLAFVYIAERRGAQQFRVYRDLLSDDPETEAMFARIMRDEKFHMSYSKAALDKLAKAGRAGAVRWAMVRVKARRYWQAWLRFSHRVATFMNGLMFTLLYFLLVAPTHLLSSSKDEAKGWRVPAPPAPTLDAVRHQF